MITTRFKANARSIYIACNQILLTHKVINEMVASSNPQDIDGIAKIS
jgi:hypothetical protein